jgi:hypothetical protein
VPPPAPATRPAFTNLTWTCPDACAKDDADHPHTDTRIAASQIESLVIDID